MVHCFFLKKEKNCLSHERSQGVTGSRFVTNNLVLFTEYATSALGVPLFL